MSAIKLALQQNQSRGKRKSGEMSTDVSPDSKCPICLDMFNNISYLDLCLHKFCFRCIHEWSKNKAECPLCKQPFNSIYHSIKSEKDFKKYDLKPADNGSFGTLGGVRFRYRTTVTGVHRQMQRTIAPPENGVMFEASTNPPQRQDRYIHRIMNKLAAQRRAASEGRSFNNLREQEMINFRKELYRQGVRVRGVRDGGRSRDTSAEFFRRNPACLHRLVPWLKRELMVLYGAHGSLVNIVQHIVMSRITRYDVEDAAMLEELRPFLQGCTEHFLHEFISFAKSPFNMEAYDQHAVYDYVGPSSTDENSSNSSVIAISEDEEQSVELDPPGDFTSTNMSHSMWDDETPGPSYSTQSEPSRVEQLSLPDSDSDSSLDQNHMFREPVETVIPLNQKEAFPRNEHFSSDTEDCVIVGFVKPTAERTPELVQLSSNSSGDSAAEDITERIHMPQHIRFSSVSPAASISSCPVEDGMSEKGGNVFQPLKERHKTASSTKHRSHTSEKKSKETHKDSHRSKKREQRIRRRSQSRERRTPESRHRGNYYSNRDDYYYYYKRRDGHSTYSLSSTTHSGSYHWHGRYTRSRSRSREFRRRDRGRSKSRTYSSSRSPSVKRKTHHEKPGGKRKYKTRHLEEPGDNTKRDSSKHRKKSKDKERKRDTERHSSENSPDRSRRHRKKKKKHKKKSKRHRSTERKEKHVPSVITIDSDGNNSVDETQYTSLNIINSPSKTSLHSEPPPPLDTEALSD